MKSTVVQDNRGWRRVNGHEELLTGEGEEVGDGRAEGSSATGDGGQAGVSLMPDNDGTGSGSLLDSVQSTLLTKRSSDVCVPPVMLGLE